MKKFKNKIIYLLIAFIIFHFSLFIIHFLSASSPSADEIMQKTWWSTKIIGLEALSTLLIYNSKGQKRIKKIALISKLYDDGHTEKRLLRFLAPPDEKGTGLLTFDYEKKEDHIWFYMPSIRKTERIAASEKSKNFMGSEFTYADITPPPVDDFNHSILGSEEVEGIKCWVIESTPKTYDIAEENGFSKRISYVGKDDYVVRKRIYFDLDNELHKELIVYAIREIDPDRHRFYPIHMEIFNKQNQRRSVLKADAVKFRPNIPDSYFTRRYLERE